MTTNCIKINGMLIETDNAAQMQQIVHALVFAVRSMSSAEDVENVKTKNTATQPKLQKKTKVCEICKAVFHAPVNYPQKKTCGQETCLSIARGKTRKDTMTNKIKKKTYGHGTDTSTQLNDWPTGKGASSGSGVINARLGNAISNSGVYDQCNADVTA